MTKQELIQRLVEISEQFDDIEVSHIEADKALLEYINDEAVTDAFDVVPKWYA